MDQEKVNLAVLFADVSDCARLYKALGDKSAFGSVREIIGLLRSIAETCGGRVVKSIGDGLMCAFPDADAAAIGAAEMQRRIEQLPPLASGKVLTIRIGFHLGPVIRDGEDVFGDSVNVAARMAGLALAGQAITTRDTVATLSAQMRESMRRLDAPPVEGKTEEIEVHELLWRTSPVRTIAPGRSESLSNPGGGPRIRITHQGKDLVFKDTVYIGREAAGNHVLVADPMTSRRHAKIELRGTRFVLVDQSANGTFVTLGPDGEIKLLREELILHGTGVISFGHSASSPNAETVRFTLY